MSLELRAGFRSLTATQASDATTATAAATPVPVPASVPATTTAPVAAVAIPLSHPASLLQATIYPMTIIHKHIPMST